MFCLKIPRTWYKICRVFGFFRHPQCRSKLKIPTQFRAEIVWHEVCIRRRQTEYVDNTYFVNYCLELKYLLHFEHIDYYQYLLHDGMFDFTPITTLHHSLCRIISAENSFVLFSVVDIPSEIDAILSRFHLIIKTFRR